MNDLKRIVSLECGIKYLGGLEDFMDRLRCCFFGVYYDFVLVKFFWNRKIF